MGLGWVITGPYLFITAIYKPLWITSEGKAGTIQNRPKFILRFLARLFDYIFVVLFLGVLGGILDLFIPNSLIIIERSFLFILLGYLFISLFFFHKTIGDRIFKLELCSYKEDGKLSFTQIFIRTFFAPIGAIQGLFFVLSSKKYLGHDRISNTDMIKKVS
jgi:uncharacterized RDD family membrane protein YckC